MMVQDTDCLKFYSDGSNLIARMIYDNLMNDLNPSSSSRYQQIKSCCFLQKII